jgi:LacI family transcriptional regulator
MAKARRRIIVSVLATGLFGREVAQGVHDFATRHGGWELHFEGASNHPEVLSRVRLAIEQWGADGIIGQVLYQPLISIIRRARLTVVNVSSSVRSRLPSVYVDHEAVGRMAAEYYLDRNVRNFAYCGRAANHLSDLRGAGFGQRLAKSGFDCARFPPPGVPRDAWTQEFRDLQAWLRRLPHPTGILVCDDLLGQEVLQACRIVGLSVPDEIAVMGVDNDTHYCLLSDPPLASVITPCRQVGFEAAGLMERLLRGGKEPRSPIVLPPLGIATRRSSELLAIEDPGLAAAIRFIHDHAGDEIEVGDVVRACAVSRRSLERRFLAVLQRTPRQEILRAHMEKARNLLTQTDWKVATIGRACGVNQYVRFTRVFRRLEGMTPSEYRNRHRKVGG